METADNVSVHPFHDDTITNVKPEKGIMIQHILEKGRRHFGRPGASLTQLDDPQFKGKLPEGWKHEVVDIALGGEEETSSMIKSWMKDKPNAVLFDSVHIKGSGKEEVDPETGLIEEGDTDHILLVGNHILVIDSKKWKGGKDEEHAVNYIQNDKGEVQRFGKTFPGGKVHIGAALKMWFRYLQTNNDESKVLMGMIHIVNDYTKVLRYKNWYEVRNKKYWYLCEKSRFIELLDEWYDKQVSEPEKHFISSDLAAQIAVCCCRPYDRRAHLINMKPLERYKTV